MRNFDDFFFNLQEKDKYKLSIFCSQCWSYCIENVITFKKNIGFTHLSAITQAQHFFQL